MDCPPEFQHSFNNLSLGPYTELDISDTSGSIQITISGHNLPYPDVVDYANNEDVFTKGQLVTRGKTLSVFKYNVPVDATGSLQQVYVVRDLGNLRTGIIQGRIAATAESTMDDLTRICTRIADSMIATSNWTSDGKGGPGP